MLMIRTMLLGMLLVGVMAGSARASVTYAMHFTRLSGPALDLAGSFTLSHPPAASGYTRYDPVNPQNTLLNMNVWVDGARSNMVDDVSYSEAPVVLFADGALVYADLNTVAPNLNFSLVFDTETGQHNARFDVDGGTVFASYTTSVVPVPAALPLAATALAGLGGLGWMRRRRRSVSQPAAA